MRRFLGRLRRCRAHVVDAQGRPSIVVGRRPGGEVSNSRSSQLGSIGVNAVDMWHPSVATAPLGFYAVKGGIDTSKLRADGFDMGGNRVGRHGNMSRLHKVLMALDVTGAAGEGVYHPILR